MKKILYIGLTLIQMALAFGGYLIQDYSMKRMGMMRHVVVQNRTWEKAYSIDQMRMVAMGVLVLMSLVVVLVQVRRNIQSFQGLRLYRSLETLVMTAGVVGFIYKYTTQDYRSYYYLCLVFVVIMGLQYLKQATCLRRSKTPYTGVVKYFV